jgi:aldehyde dehydrogenase (NAD+)
MALSVLGWRDRLGVGPGRLLVDGGWVDAGGGRWPHVHPASGEEVTTVGIATAEDVDRAVRAARRAFDEGPWPRMKARERTRLLRRVVEAILAHAEEFDRLQTLDNGMPAMFSSMYQVSAEIMADLFDHYAGWVDKIAGETLPTYTGDDAQVLTLREPVGVVGAVIPWNAPLILLGLKLAPALATGCTVVLKPSEHASLCALRLGQLLLDVGLPEGVVNIVTGPGASTGEALISHPLVDKLTFTGSRDVGRHVMEIGARTLKRVTLELGGKSAIIIFPDAPDLGLAAMTAMGQVAMGLSGQGCACHTRALVHEDIYDQVLAQAQGLVAMVRQGDPFAPETTAGPIISTRQLERVLGYIARGRDEGARLVCGGTRAGGELAAGNWIEPTLFAGVDNRMTIAREEIFGPVLAAIPFRSEDEAIAIANDSSYGLAGSVYTTDVRRALRVARAIRTGTFGVNTYGVMPNAPFGGYKMSGIGREGGRATLEAFTEVKTVTVALG